MSTDSVTVPTRFTKSGLIPSSAEAHEQNLLSIGWDDRIAKVF